MTTLPFPLPVDALAPFQAYRRASQPPIFELCASLSHFFEAEKFRRPETEELRQEVLSCPTARAARKLSRRHASSWREDWKQIRSRVFRAGLAMQMSQCPEVKAQALDLAGNALEWSSQRALVAGLPVAWVAREVLALQEGRTSKTTPRLGLLTFSGYTPPDLGARLSALFAGERPSGAAVYIGEECDRQAEYWCMEAATPLRYVGDTRQRLRSESSKDLLNRINRLIICAPATRKDVKALITQAKQKRIAVQILTAEASDRALIGDQKVQLGRLASIA